MALSISNGVEKKRILDSFAYSDNLINSSDDSSKFRSRMAYFGPSLGNLNTPIMSRQQLRVKPQEGPLIVEEYDATCVIPPGYSASVDCNSNIDIRTQI